jgi:acetoin utilization deacetylase AcuC-like enzyme
MTAPSFVYTPDYEADIGAHVFRNSKYRETRDRLLAAGVPADAFVPPRERDRRILSLAHDPEYLDDLFALRVTRRTASSELPLTGEIVRWFELAVAGTVTATEMAMEGRGVLHLGGGFHHAFAGHAEGFCYLNDVAVAARLALGDGGGGDAVEPASRITVVDLDVHQGNGTARIFRGDPRVFTFSMHQENNYPLKEESDLDIGLDDRTGDDEYLRELDRGLAQAVLDRRPDLVYYVAGADPYREDLLGGLALTLDGMGERDRRVFAACREAGAPAVVVLAGGYAARPEDTVSIHARTARELLAAWPPEETGGAGAGNPKGGER